MSEMTINFIFCVAYVFAGIVILSCLKRLGLIKARNIFAWLYGVLMIYIPYYFVGNLLTDIVCRNNSGSVFAAMLRMIANNSFQTPSMVFRSLSIITVIAAVLIACATLVVLAVLAVKIVCWIVGLFRPSDRRKNPVPRAAVFTDYLCSFQHTYLEYCRLLN